MVESSGCTSCHSLDGSERIGPTFQGLYGKKIVIVTKGKNRTVIADRDYLKRSILDPQADVVEGFRPRMPTNYEQKLGEAKVNNILDYLQTIGSK
nr:c-type cytochrome [Desulfobulbaceae bacterium]